MPAVNAWKSPLRTLKIDKLLEQVSVCAESVRTSAEALMEELILDSYSATTSMQTQLDHVLQQQKLMQMVINKAQGTGSSSWNWVVPSPVVLPSTEQPTDAHPPTMNLRDTHQGRDNVVAANDNVNILEDCKSINVALFPATRDPSELGSGLGPEATESILGSSARHTNFGPFTDSGYASLERYSGAPERNISLPQCSPGTENSSGKDDDAVTVYSATWSISENELDMYKSELVDTILDSIRSTSPDAKLVKPLSDSLPALLKAFALRLGCVGSSKAEREVMYFVHRHRL